MYVCIVMLSAPPPLGPTCFEHKTTFICKAYLPVWRNKSVHLQKQSKKVAQVGCGVGPGPAFDGFWMGTNSHVFSNFSPRFFPQKNRKPVLLQLQLLHPDIFGSNGRPQISSIAEPKCHIIQLMNFRQKSSYIHPTGHLKSISRKNESPNFSLQLRRDLLWEFILHCSKPSSGLQVFFSSHTQWQLNSNECVMVKPPEGQNMMVKIPRCFCQHEARQRYIKDMWQQKEWSFSRKNRIRFRVFGCLFRLKSK